MPAPTGPGTPQSEALHPRWERQNLKIEPSESRVASVSSTKLATSRLTAPLLGRNWRPKQSFVFIVILAENYAGFPICRPFWHPKIVQWLLGLSAPDAIIE
jgi:hypothetical protein